MMPKTNQLNSKYPKTQTEQRWDHLNLQQGNLLQVAHKEAWRLVVSEGDGYTSKLEWYPSDITS
jgi:hypothetical protein